MNLMTGDSERQLENLIHEIMEDSCARGIAAGVVDAEGNILYEKYFAGEMRKRNSRSTETLSLVWLL